MIRPGQLLARRYRVERLLARGGMAEIYLGTDEQSHERVAVKLLHPHFVADPTFVQRFRAEAMAAGRLVHPNIVRCLDFGVEDGQPFLVMEYVAGETLAERLARERYLAPHQAVALVRPVLAALAYVHEHGLVHRDVKPANVLVAEDGTVKLTDFGIAQAVAAATLTRTGQVLGSVHYVAPERLRGMRATPASDCYAVGVLLYRMLTGRLPFEGDDVAGVMAQQLHHLPPPPSSVRPELPAWLDQVVLHALEKEPAQRYPSASALLAALDAGPTTQLSATAIHAAIRAAGLPQASAAAQGSTDRGGRDASSQSPSLERTTPFEPSAAATHARKRRPALSWRAAGVGTAALVLLGFASQLGSLPSVQSTEPSATGTRVVAVGPTPQPTTMPSTPVPAPSTPSVRTTTVPALAAPAQPAPPVQSTVSEVRSLVQEAIATGRVTKKRGELQETVGKLERQIPAGEYNQAREQADKLGRTVRELAADNEINRGVAERLLARLTTLRGHLDDLAPRPARAAGRREG